MKRDYKKKADDGFASLQDKQAGRSAKNCLFLSAGTCLIKGLISAYSFLDNVLALDGMGKGSYFRISFAWSSRCRDCRDVVVARLESSTCRLFSLYVSTSDPMYILAES